MPRILIFQSDILRNINWLFRAVRHQSFGMVSDRSHSSACCRASSPSRGATWCSAPLIGRSQPRISVDCCPLSSDSGSPPSFRPARGINGAAPVPDLADWRGVSACSARRALSGAQTRKPTGLRLCFGKWCQGLYHRAVLRGLSRLSLEPPWDLSNVRPAAGLCDSDTAAQICNDV